MGTATNPYHSTLRARNVEAATFGRAGGLLGVDAAPLAHDRPGRRILVGMKSSRGGARRHLPTSPFAAPPAPPPVEQFAIDDRVSHDKYGLGVVVGVEEDSAVLVDFGTQKVRIPAPYPKLFKL
jgi:hypothetical protein